MMGRSMQYEVFCHLCGLAYLEQDPDVRLIYTDHVWECADESGCADRRAMNRLNGGAA